MSVLVKAKGVELEQYWLGPWLHLIFLHETQEHLQSDSLNEWSGGKVSDSVPETASFKDKKDDEIIELKAEQLIVLESTRYLEHNQCLKEVLVNQGANKLIFEKEPGVLEIHPEGIDRFELDVGYRTAQLQISVEYQQQLEVASQVLLNTEEVEILLCLLHSIHKEWEG